MAQMIRAAGPVVGLDRARILEMLRSANEKVATAPDGGFVREAAAILAVAEALRRGDAEAARLRALIDAPELHDFAKGVVMEAAHQRERWAAEHDAGKSPADWFWLIGFLAQKAMMAAIAGDPEKARHHCISTAAALANWFRQIAGLDTTMRPGIEPPRGEA